MGIRCRRSSGNADEQLLAMWELGRITIMATVGDVGDCLLADGGRKRWAAASGACRHATSIGSVKAMAARHGTLMFGAACEGEVASSDDLGDLSDHPF